MISINIATQNSERGLKQWKKCAASNHNIFQLNLLLLQRIILMKE